MQQGTFRSGQGWESDYAMADAGTRRVVGGCGRARARVGVKTKEWRGVEAMRVVEVVEWTGGNARDNKRNK